MQQQQQASSARERAATRARQLADDGATLISIEVRRLDADGQSFSMYEHVPGGHVGYGVYARVAAGLGSELRSLEDMVVDGDDLPTTAIACYEAHALAHRLAHALRVPMS